MIVRISTEGQYRLDDESAARLNALDNDVVAAVDAGDEAVFDERFALMIQFVRREGSELGSGTTAPSEERPA